jgi:hypothetical protein
VCAMQLVPVSTVCLPKGNSRRTSISFWCNNVCASTCLLSPSFCTPVPAGVSPLLPSPTDNLDCLHGAGCPACATMSWMHLVVGLVQLCSRYAYLHGHHVHAIKVSIVAK